MEKIYDLIILGGGPASMNAGIYAMQTKLDTLLIEKDTFGGQIATTSSVTNYLGFEYITGRDLSEKMHNHLLSTGIEISNEEVTKTILDEEIKHVYTHNNHYQAYAVVIGIGTSIRKLGIPNENAYIGHGLSYTPLKDREKFENKPVAVVGGGNSALEDAIYLSEKASKVYLIHRRNEFRADPKLIEDLHNKIKQEGKIELCLESKPLEIVGKSEIESFRLIHIPDEKVYNLEVAGVFASIGRGADTDIIDEKIKELRAMITQNMESRRLKIVESSMFTIKYIPPKVVMQFDSKAFKDDYEELYNSYCKPKQKKASIVVKK